MSTTIDIVQALGPGIHLSKLNRFTASYKTAVESFDDLLTYPFLQSIFLNEGEKHSDDLRTIVADGNSRYSQLCTANISIAQQAISYGKAVPALLKSLTIGEYAINTQPLIAQYVAQALESANANEQFFEEFQTYILLLDNQINNLTKKIANLTIKIEEASDELTHANVGRVIGDLIRSLFKLATGGDGDIQIADLLKIGIETLKSSFTQLWKDQQRLKDLITGLTVLKENLSAIQALFSTLSQALTGIIFDCKSLLSAWTDVQGRVASAEAVDEKISEEDLQQVVGNWRKASDAAKDYIDTVSGSGSTKAMSGDKLLQAVQNPHVKQVSRVPRTKGELKMALLLASLRSGIDLESQPSIWKSISDKDEILKAAGPPAETWDILKGMILQTSGVMQQFEDLLQIPFLNQLQCVDPDKPSQKINIQVMVTNYQKMYQDLQQQTVPVIQDLQTYADTVLYLLPKLVATSSTKPGEITVATYIAAHQTLADEYKLKADEIFNKSLNYKNLWDNATTTVRQAINECKTNMTIWQDTIDSLDEQIKMLTLKAVLVGVGALACFAAAAFIPGGLLASGPLVTGGVILIGMVIADIIAIGTLHTTINELKARIELARDTQAKLEYILPFMVKIADSLTRLTAIWSDISQGLNDIQAWNLLLINPNLLVTVRPLLLDSWTNVRDATERYINAITGHGI